MNKVIWQAGSWAEFLLKFDFHASFTLNYILSFYPTAAAGGTGQFAVSEKKKTKWHFQELIVASLFFTDGDHYDKEILVLQVQLAKLAGCHVIGTCSTDAKGEFLKVSLLMFLLGPLFSKVSVTRASRKAVRLSPFQIQAWCFKFYFTLLERFFHRTRCKDKATKHDPFGQSENECYKRIMSLSEFKYKCPSSAIGKAHQRTKGTNKLFL